MKLSTLFAAAVALLALSGCASDDFLVGEGDIWWEKHVGGAARSTSIDTADRIWSNNGERKELAYRYSIARGELIFSKDMEDDTRSFSVSRAERSISSDANWQDLLRRFSISQAERDWSRRASSK